jgi:uncharacterized protein
VIGAMKKQILKEEIQNLYYQMDRLLVYRAILKDRALKLLREYIYSSGDSSSARRNSERLLNEIYYELIKEAEQYKFQGNLWRCHILKLVMEDENVFSLIAEKDSFSEDTILYNSSLYKALINDFYIISEIYNLDLVDMEEVNKSLLNPIDNYIPVNQIGNEYENSYRNTDKIGSLKQYFDRADLQGIIQSVSQYYKTSGCGTYARYSAFKWDETQGIIGIDNPDFVKFENLVGSESQKQTLIKNTEAFINGFPANNVLLFGHRGTGKSSSVKALLTKFADSKLKLIEVSKDQLKDFPRIIQHIKNRGYKFIIFMDDLSFEDFEVEYKYMKSMLEGGVEEKPSNVLIYATSNRRHLIKETWADRNSGSEEISVTESIQEKLSLVDRFGITITYLTPSQKEYLDIVYALAKKNNINMSEDKLREEAVKWEMRYNGRSGRTAQQFINYLSGQI